MVIVEELAGENAEVVKRSVDYGLVADSFLEEDDSNDDDESGGSDSDDDHEVLLVHHLVGDGSSDNESSEAMVNDEDSDDQSSEDGESDEDDDEADDGVVQESVQHSAKTLIPSASSLGEQCTFDLRNLVAINTHQISVNELYTAASKSASSESIAIPGERLPCGVNEAHLLEKALDGCTQLVSVIWQLPTEPSDAGQLVSLPPFDEIKIPRALPPPAAQKETKWEKFAKERGIGQNQSKRTRKVWDEKTGTWMYRHGYQKANDDSKEWPILEVKRNEDPNEDPWERLRDAKRTRTDKNLKNRMRNEEKAGSLPKGTTTRVMKSREKVRKAGKLGGNMDRDNVVPVGVPVDLKPRKGSDKLTPLKRGKESTLAALSAVQQSTASLGKFDKMREGEPERKKARLSSNKKKLEGATDRKVLASEAERGLKVLNTVLNGGPAREKARKKGEFAKGETAYDYDYNDGLGASSFKKKKGRAGAGKMKKMTKKRVK